MSSGRTLHTFWAKLLRIFCYLLLVGAGVWQLRLALQDQLIFSNNVDRLELNKIRDAGVLTYSAKQKQVFEADMAGAVTLLQRALLFNPLYVPAWLGLAEVYNDLGQKSEANNILEYVDLLTNGIKRWRWEKTMTAYQLNKTEMLSGDLRFIIREIPGKTRNDAMQMAFTIWDTPQDLIENTGSENILHLFKHAVVKKYPEKALFWDRIEQENLSWTKSEVVPFLNMLLDTGHIPQAAEIWRKHFNPDKILYNSAFSQPFMMNAFGWRIGKSKEFVQRIEQAEKVNTLHYRFKGWENLNFYHLTQVVPVTGGKIYELSYEAKAKKLTTDQRPYFEVSGYKCEGLIESFDMIQPDQEMVHVKFSFGVPEGCDAIVLRMRRKESRQIDNKMSGQLWIRNIALTDTGIGFHLLDMGLL